MSDSMKSVAWKTEMALSKLNFYHFKYNQVLIHCLGEAYNMKVISIESPILWNLFHWPQTLTRIGQIESCEKYMILRLQSFRVEERYKLDIVISGAACKFKSAYEIELSWSSK